MTLCPNCGKGVFVNTRFYPACGAAQSPRFAATAPMPPSSAIVQYKSPGVAVVLSLILGVVGLMGIGHLYVGKLSKGLSLLIVGIILGILTWGSFITGFVTFGLGFLASASFGLMLFALWFWQMWDTYVLAKVFNRRVQETGLAPW